MKQHELHTALADAFKDAQGNSSNEFTITVDFREKLVRVKSSVKKHWEFSLAYTEYTNKSVSELVTDISTAYKDA